MKQLTSLFPDALLVFGAASVSYGAWMLLPSAGYLVAGAFSLVAGVLLSKAVK